MARYKRSTGPSLATYRTRGLGNAIRNGQELLQSAKADPCLTGRPQGILEVHNRRLHLSFILVLPRFYRLGCKRTRDESPLKLLLRGRDAVLEPKRPKLSYISSPMVLNSPVSNPDPAPTMVEVLASEIRLDEPASVQSSSKGEDGKPNVKSPPCSLVTRDNILNSCPGVSSADFESLWGNRRTWIRNPDRSLSS